jgi:hypothetical protein
MGTIYRLATRVRIWLGKADGQSRGVFELLSRMYCVGSAEENISEQLDFLRATDLPPNALVAFLARPWFSRRWILQEAVLNSHTTVHCGDLSVPWAHLCESVHVLEAMCKPKDSTGESIPFIKVLRTCNDSQSVMSVLGHLRSSEKNLLSLLWDSHTSSCTDPRDRFGALYGLAGLSPRILEEMKVDLQRPWPELYTIFAKEFILQGKGLQLMSHLLAFGSLPSQMCCPSYVPNWSASKNQASYFNRIFGAMQLNETRLGVGEEMCGLKESAKTTASIPKIRIHGLYWVVNQVSNFRPKMDSRDRWLGFFDMISRNNGGFAIPAKHHLEYESWKTVRSALAIEQFLRHLFTGHFVREVEGSLSAPMIPTLLQLSAEDSIVAAHQPDFKAASIWMATFDAKSRVRTPWVTHCLSVLQSLLQNHSFFIGGKTTKSGLQRCYGFGPLNLSADHSMVSFDKPVNHAEDPPRYDEFVSVGCAISRHELRIEGPCFFIPTNRYTVHQGSIDFPGFEVR